MIGTGQAQPPRCERRADSDPAALMATAAQGDPRLTWLASFAELDPGPVVEVDLAAGSVYYANPAARHRFPDLIREGLRHPWLQGLRDVAAGSCAPATPAVRRKVEVDGVWYEQSLCWVPGHARLRVYARETTEDRQIVDNAHAALHRCYSLLEVTGQVGWTTDAAGRVVEDMPMWRKFTGQSFHEMQGDGWTSALHPDDRESATRVWRNAVRTGLTYETEYRLWRHDGVYRSVLARGIPSLSADGTVREWVGTCIDITERKRAEEAQHEQELFYRQTLESIPGMVFTTLPNGFCDYQNQQWVEFTGVPVSEHLGDGWNQLLHPEDQVRAFAAWRAAVEGRAPYDLEYRVRRHDGVYEWFKVRARPIRNAAGQVVRWFGTALNIDHLVQAQAAVRRSEQLYRAIGETIDFGIWVCAPDGRNTYASESFLKLVGLTQEQCSNFGWGHVLHPDDAERTMGAGKECVRTGGVWDIEHRFRGVDGQWHPVLARGVPVRDESGTVLCWAGLNLDISRLKRAEENLAASLREKEVLLREIHHRVKNNLQILSSLVSLQIGKLTDPAARRELESLRGRVRSIAMVHEKLYETLGLARLDFAQYARGLLTDLWSAHGADAAGVRLELELETVPLPIDAALPCGLVLNELVANALKHAFRGRSDGVVSVSLCLAADGRACLRVRDNGIGLPPGLVWHEVRSLGLQLVRILTEQLGGTLEVHLGTGTEFELAFGELRRAP